MPESATMPSRALSHWNMSRNPMVPDRSISASASRRPAWMSAAVSRTSNARMCSSQVCSGTSSE